MGQNSSRTFTLGLDGFPERIEGDYRMFRKQIDCREFLGDKNCTLAISGSEDEVIDMAIIHAIISHGHDDPFELRNEVRSLLKDVPERKATTA
jgi:hypothetical protein